jgi:hypothetical protein
MTTIHSQTKSCIHPVVYDAVRHLVRNGDVALCRGSTPEGAMISEITGSQYTHATMLGWAKPKTLMIGETRQHRDGRLIDARSEIAHWPGYYDVFRVRSQSFRGDAAWTFMCHAAGSRYNWRHIFLYWARRWFGRPSQRLCPLPNSDDPSAMRFCSELVHAALRAGGGPQVAEYDCDVAPGDLADPKKFRYLFTVFATLEQVAAFQRGIGEPEKEVGATD